MPVPVFDTVQTVWPNFHHREVQVRHQVMAHCCAVRTLRALHALTYEPCSDRVRRPYRKHQRFHHQHRDRGLRLGHRPDVRIHQELRLVRHLVRHLGVRSLRQPDVARLKSHLDVERHHRHPVRHLGDLDRQGDLHHRQDEGRQGDPFPVMERKDCCQGG